MTMDSLFKVNKWIKGIIINLRSLPWIRWDPDWDIFFVLATLLYMIPSYYLMANNQHQLAIYNFMFASLFVLVLLPAYYVLKVRGESLEEIGITWKKWLFSMLISILIVLRLSPMTLSLLFTIPQEFVLPTVIFNGLCLWEPFFVFCWVQLRFERAFGILAGILAAGLCLGLYHIGTYSLGMVIRLGMVGLFYGGVFRITRNLLVLWPLTWTVSSTMGTVSGGFIFGWKSVWIYTVILLVQGTGIWWIERTRQNHKGPELLKLKYDGLKASKTTWRLWILSSIYGFIMVFQIVFTYFNYNNLGFDSIANFGWLVLMISAVFGWMPILTLRNKGGVPKGKNYMHTTILVDSGIYAIVRHPQFFAGILISLALVLISQHWLNIIFFTVVVFGTYLDSLRADKMLKEKFGDEYKSYMKSVPSLNPLTWIFQLFKSKKWFK